MEIFDCMIVFFFQAEDGIRDIGVTGVQTCALPICTTRRGLLVIEGVIDNAYTGELLVACLNFAGEDVHVKEGDRLAQLICCRSEERRVGKECRSRWSAYH